MFFVYSAALAILLTYYYVDHGHRQLFFFVFCYNSHFKGTVKLHRLVQAPAVRAICVQSIRATGKENTAVLVLR